MGRRRPASDAPVGILTGPLGTRVLTPLMDLTKAETWALAERLGVLDYVRENTLTCYNGVVGRGCGACPSCVLRRRGYEAYLNERGASC